MSQAATEPLLDPEFLRKLEQLALAAKRVQLGHAKGERKSKRKGSSVEFADYRDYVQGDDLRHVDWNIFGRLDSLYLKLFQEQEDLTVYLLLDISQSMAFGDPPKIEFARKLAAAIGYIALVSYDRVCVEALVDGTSHRLRPIRGKASAAQLFSYLRMMEPGGETRLEEACRTHMLRSRTKGVAVILSDFFDPDGFEGGLRRMVQTGSEVYALHVLARDEIEPKVTGDLRLLDAETNAYTEISVSPLLLKRYRENVQGFCESVRRFCLARNMGYVFAPTDAPFERMMLEVLRQGGMLR